MRFEGRVRAALTHTRNFSASRGSANLTLPRSIARRWTSPPHRLAYTQRAHLVNKKTPQTSADISQVLPFAAAIHSLYIASQQYERLCALVPGYGGPRGCCTRRSHTQRYAKCHKKYLHVQFSVIKVSNVVLVNTLLLLLVDNFFININILKK